MYLYTPYLHTMRYIYQITYIMILNITKEDKKIIFSITIFLGKFVIFSVFEISYVIAHTHDACRMGLYPLSLFYYFISI